MEQQYFQQDCQSRNQRLNRFLLRSTAEKFYIETMQGGIMMPNEFCAHKSNGKIDSFICVKRRERSIKILHIVLSESGNFMSISQSEGDVIDFSTTLEREVIGAELYGLQSFQDNAKEALKKFFEKINFNF